MVFNEKTQKWESPYWHPAVTTDAVVFGFGKEDKSLQVLLIKRGKAKAGEVPAFEGYWALPGGFIREEDETAMDGVFRELHEETNVNDIYLEELKTFSNSCQEASASSISAVMSARMSFRESTSLRSCSRSYLMAVSSNDI